MLLRRDDSILLLVDVQEKLTPLVSHSERLLDHCEWLLKLAQKMNVPILVSEQYPQRLGSTLKRLSSYFNEQECIDKVSFSCMSEPRLVARLKQLNKKQVILIGIETHVCILQTALEMRQKELNVFVVVDAVSCRGEHNMKYGLKRMKQEGVHLITSEMIFFEWLRKAGSSEFKELSKVFF